MTVDLGTIHNFTDRFWWSKLEVIEKELFLPILLLLLLVCKASKAVLE
jgi:hypothetical protein